MIVRLVLLAGVLTPPIAAAQVKPVTRTPTLYEDLQMFSQVLNQIRVNHLDSVDTHGLILAAIEGMIHAADPHSYLLPVARLSPDKARALDEGELWPVPIAFRFVGGAPVVAAVAPASKAARIDVLPGDELVAIDGQPVQAESAGELELVLAGPKGSSVRLSLARQRSDGSRLEVVRDVTREAIRDGKAVPVSLMLDDRTGYVRLTTFAIATTADELHDAVGRLNGRGMQRLVLDLRDNGGGLVDEAAKVAGVFLPSGSIVYVSEQRKNAKPDTVVVTRSFWKRERRVPMVVLINEGTASAAELVAGALQDHDRALLVGRPSFGKSLLMRGFPLLDGSVIVMAFGRVLTPCGRVVQRDYRGLSRRDYYRLAGAEGDTAGRPSCRTRGGRTVYGGGGIHPDVRLPGDEPAPVWLARLAEDGLPLKWAGGYVTEAGLPPLDSLVARPSVPPAALESFRRFAAAAGHPVPADSAAAVRVEELLVRRLALTRYGAEGFYRVSAALDRVVRQATHHFEAAAGILPP